MRNTAEAMTMREFSKDLYQKAEWHQKASEPGTVGMSDDFMERALHRLKSEIFADIARSAEETAERISQ